MQENDRFSMRVPGFLIINPMPVTNIQEPLMVGSNLRIEDPSWFTFVHARIMEGSIPEYHQLQGTAWIPNPGRFVSCSVSRHLNRMVPHSNRADVCRNLLLLTVMR